MIIWLINHSSGIVIIKCYLVFIQELPPFTHPTIPSRRDSCPCNSLVRHRQRSSWGSIVSRWKAACPSRPIRELEVAWDWLERCPLEASVIALCGLVQRKEDPEVLLSNCWTDSSYSIALLSGRWGGVKKCGYTGWRDGWMDWWILNQGFKIYSWSTDLSLNK